MIQRCMTDLLIIFVMMLQKIMIMLNALQINFEDSLERENPLGRYTVNGLCLQTVQVAIIRSKFLLPNNIFLAPMLSADTLGIFLLLTHDVLLCSDDALIFNYDHAHAF